MRGYGWWRKPGGEHGRCTVIVPECWGGGERRCRNKAHAEGLCKLHLRRIGHARTCNACGSVEYPHDTCKESVSP